MKPPYLDQLSRRIAARASSFQDPKRADALRLRDFSKPATPRPEGKA